MDQIDALGIFDVLPARARRRIVAGALLVLTAAGLVAPNLQVSERAVRWLIEVRVQQVQDTLENLVANMMKTLQTPTQRSTDAPRAR
jgi:hypothetical protein